MQKQTVSEAQSFREREFFDKKLQMLQDIQKDLGRTEIKVVKVEHIDEIAHLLSKQGLPLDEAAKGASKSKLMWEFQLARRRVMKKLLVANLRLAGLQQAVNAPHAIGDVLSPAGTQ